MARTGNSLKQAATELEQEVTNEQCANILRRASFTKLLWQERHRYFTELARDPAFSADTVVGKFLVLAQKLEEEGNADKAAEVLLKLCKVKGWTVPDSNINILGDLSAKDIERLKTRLANKQTEGKNERNIN